jgi:hypothetical protein
VDFDDGEMKPLKLKSPEFETRSLDWHKKSTLAAVKKAITRASPEYLRVIVSDTEQCRAPIHEIMEIETSGRYMRVEYRPERAGRQWEPGTPQAPITIDIQAYIDHWVEKSEHDNEMKATLKELGTDLCMS